MRTRGLSDGRSDSSISPPCGDRIGPPLCVFCRAWNRRMTRRNRDIFVYGVCVCVCERKR